MRFRARIAAPLKRPRREIETLLLAGNRAQALRVPRDALHGKMATPPLMPDKLGIP